MNYGSKKQPKFADVEEAMNKRFKLKDPKTNKWLGIKVKEIEQDDIMDDLDN